MSAKTVSPPFNHAHTRTDPATPGVNFVKALLELNPEARMTLKDAISHPWLARFRPSAPKRERTATPPLEAPRAVPASVQDVSMKADDGGSAAAEPGSSQSTGCPVPGAFPLGSQDPARALQRRRKILDDAREQGVQPPEPTPEMILFAQREDGAGDARPLKRKLDVDSSLSPMPEEDGEAMALVPLDTPAKKGKRGPKAVKGRGKVAAVEAEDLPRVRRSNRLGAGNA